MVVVADTSPLNYLILIGAVDILPELFGNVRVPPAVIRELRDADAPVSVRAWAEEPPAWIQELAPPDSVDPALDALDPGEREAIALALANAADLLLIDERPARRIAIRCGLQITGTLGVLVGAARRGLVDFPAAVAQLRRTSFRVTEAVLESLPAPEVE